MIVGIVDLNCQKCNQFHTACKESQVSRVTSLKCLKYQKTLLGDMGAQLTCDNSQSLDTTMQFQLISFN